MGKFVKDLIGVIIFVILIVLGNYLFGHWATSTGIIVWYAGQIVGYLRGFNKSDKISQIQVDDLNSRLEMAYFRIGHLNKKLKNKKTIK